MSASAFDEPAMSASIADLSVGVSGADMEMADDSSLGTMAGDAVKSVVDMGTGLFSAKVAMEESVASNWQLNAIVLGLIAAVLVEFRGKSTSVNKKNIAIMAAVAAAAIQLWLVSMFYSSKRTGGYWAMFVVMLTLMAIFVYLAVVAGQSK